MGEKEKSKVADMAIEEAIKIMAKRRKELEEESPSHEGHRKGKKNIKSHLKGAYRRNGRSEKTLLEKKILKNKSPASR